MCIQHMRPFLRYAPWIRAIDREQKMGNNIAHVYNNNNNNFIESRLQDTIGK